MSISNNIFRIQQVSFNIEKQTILKDISLSLEKKKIYALIGPSGAGKTTLLQLLAGLKQPVKGQLFLKGKPPEQSVISIVPQDYGLLPWQTVEQAVCQGRRISQKRKLTAEDRKAIEHLFTQMSLTNLKKKYPNQLSGGQKQRVAIARGLASCSDVLLMDEPFSALDAFTREKAQTLFLESWQETPRLTVFVTHDIEEALLLAHEVIVLKANPGTVKKLFSSPFQKKTALDGYRRSEILFQTSLRLRKEIEE